MNFLILVISTTLAFGCVIGFEVTLASVDARTVALHLEIATQLQTLRAQQKIAEEAANVELQLAALHVTDSRRQKIAALFRDLEEIGKRRSVRVTALRHEASTGFEVTFEGAYPATLAALADLSSSHVATEASSALFARANGHVRATFLLDVLGVDDGYARS